MFIRRFGAICAAVLAIASLFCVVSCSEEDSGAPVVSVTVSAVKSVAYVDELLPVVAEVEWLADHQDEHLRFEWSIDGDAAEIDDDEGQTAYVKGTTYGTAKVKLVAYVIDSADKTVCRVGAEKELTFISRISLKSDGLVEASEYLPASVRSDIESSGGALWTSSDEEIAGIDAQTGKITPKKVGSTEITAEYGRDSSASFRLDVSVPVESVSLDPEGIRIQAGGKATARAVITPADATDGQVFWGGPNSGFVKLSFVGDEVEIEGVRPGSGTLSVMTHDGGFTASMALEVTETVRVSEVSLSQQSLSLREGQSATLSANALPSDALNRSVTWRSSDPNVVGIVPNGNSCEVRILTLPEGDGSFYVTAESSDGPSASCSVNVVKVAVDEIRIVETFDDPVPVNSSVQLTAQLTPSDADDLSVTWSSSASDIISIDAEGNASVLRLPLPEEQNPVVITARASSGVEAPVAITVDVPLTSISILGESDFAWDSENRLSVAYEPANTTWDRSITWSSSNEGIAVDDGVLTAAGSASATITAYSAYEGIFDELDAFSVKAESVGIAGNRSVTLLKGKPAKMSATVVSEPSIERFLAPVWSSSDSEKASVDGDGLVTGLSYGDAFITATSPVDGSKSDSVTVTVVEVLDVALSSSAVTMKSGETLPMAVMSSVSVLPDYEAFKGLRWSSDNDDVAEVDEHTGVVTAKGTGSAYITATSELDPTQSEKCKVSVGVNIREVVMETQSPANVRFGQSIDLSAYVDVSPDEDTYKGISWESVDPDIASVVDGTVTGNSLGSTSVVARSDTDGTKSVSCVVKVIPFVSSVSIDESDIAIRMNGDASLSANVVVLPSDSPMSSYDVTWASEVESVATVDQNGHVTPHGVGETWVTVTSNEDPAVEPARCRVVVSPSVSVSLNTVGPLQLETGDEFQLSALVIANPEYNPDNTSNFGITWSSDSECVDVDQTGRVTAVCPGSAKVSVVSDVDPSGTTYIDVEVLPKFAATLQLSQTDASFDMLGDKTLQLSVTNQFVTPFESDFNGLDWSTSESSVATVTQNGLVTAVGDGTCDITVSTNYEGSDLSAVCHVTVYTTTISVSLDPSGPLAIAIGDEPAITASVEAFPDTAANREIVWSSTNSDVVSVDAVTGALTVNGTGYTVIRAASTVLSDSYAECPITVEFVVGHQYNEDNMVLLDGGEYTLNGTADVLLSPFYIAKYTATQGLWDKVYNWVQADKPEGVKARYSDLVIANQSHFKTAPSGETASMLPVENTDWINILAFCNALSEMDGYDPVYTIDVGTKCAVCDWTKNGYRLPTEAEWEFAAFHGDDHLFPGGDDITQIAWCTNNSGNRTHAVGLKLPNANGLYDMFGNLWEHIWRSKSDDNPTGAGLDPAGLDNINLSYQKGFAWDVGQNLSNKYFASGRGKGNQWWAYGFRLARSAERISIDSVQVSPQSDFVEIGENCQLSANVSINSEFGQSVVWSSSNEAVATVDQNGLVTGVSTGSATITAASKYAPGVSGSCEITVLKQYALPGKFTINSDGDQVQFSRGNVYYNGVRLRLELNQYDFRTISNSTAVIGGLSTTTPQGQAGSTYWYSDTVEININREEGQYKTGFMPIADVWPILDISQGGLVLGNEWVPLTQPEMNYIVNSRDGAQDKRGLATVSTGSANVVGAVFLPDEWSLPSECPEFVSGWASGWTTNSYDAQQWQKMEDAGAVFLPAIGSRFVKYGSMSGLGSVGKYWTKTPVGSVNTYILSFNTSGMSVTGNNAIWDSCPIRMARYIVK